MNTHAYLEPELSSLFFVATVVVIVIAVLIVVAVDERAIGLPLGAEQSRLALLHSQLPLPVGEPTPAENEVVFTLFRS